MFIAHGLGDTGENIFLATMAMVMGAFTAGSSNQFGADMGKGRKSALTVFSYVDNKSKIDALDGQENKREIT